MVHSCVCRVHCVRCVIACVLFLRRLRRLRQQVQKGLALYTLSRVETSAYIYRTAEVQRLLSCWPTNTYTVSANKTLIPAVFSYYYFHIHQANFYGIRRAADTATDRRQKLLHGSWTRAWSNPAVELRERNISFEHCKRLLKTFL